MIILRCQLTPEDYIKAQYLHIRPNPKLKYIAIGFVGVCFVVLIASTPFQTIFINLLSLLVPLGIIGLLYPLMLWIILPWRTRKIFSQQRTLQIKHEISITPNEFTVRADIGSSEMKLSDFYQYKVSQDLILLYESEVLFHILPRHCFNSEADFQTVLNYLEFQLGKPKP